MTTTRFAPSPTGLLHIGHAYSALFAYNKGDDFILRIEDIDQTRCRPEYISAIYDDLHWLGLKWDVNNVLVQSHHFADYAAALAKLESMGLLYKCFCTRKEIKQAAAASKGAPHENETIVYSGYCRDNPREAKEGEGYSIRLDVAKALKMLKKPLRWYDEEQGWQEAEPARFGDVILARKDCPASYYLACTLDDARQGIDLITRGMDLFRATDIQVLLQSLLSSPTPRYCHHKLINDASGTRMAKRANSPTIKSFRERDDLPELQDILSFYG